MNRRMILALFKRDFLRYLSNPAGYVFITVFILVGAFAAFWQERFFMNNLANLDQLNQVFPLLLLFFVPALTMSTWAEERKLGTDELLLTLPATDWEVVLGKFLSVLGIYTVSLLFSFSHVLVLMYLGSPDIGLLFCNYLGYWLMGAALLATGMVASLLTSNVTVGFIFGTMFCAAFVLLDRFAAFFLSMMRELAQGVGFTGGVFSGTIREIVQSIGLTANFDDFGKGLIPFSSLMYFFSLTAIMLYFNLILVRRRHWPDQVRNVKRTHYTIRLVSLIVILGSLNLITSKLPFKMDMTAERLHSLSRETRDLLKDLKEDQPVLIEAFISPDVPPELVETRKDMLNYLEQYDTLGGDAITVYIHHTELFSDDAQEAEDRYDIKPQDQVSVLDGRQEITPVFLGVALTCGAEETVVPFMYPGLSVEYELTRSIRVVARQHRKKVGILTTDARMFGQFDFQSMRSTQDWPVIAELKNQYQVVQVSADEDAPDDLDALIVGLPSSLLQPQMDNLEKMIASGIPTLLFVDPYPMFSPGLSPSEPKPSPQRNPFGGGGPPPEPKGNITDLMNKIGVIWSSTQIVWDGYNPHPNLAEIPPEIVFVGEENGAVEAFNAQSPITSGLQEVVMLYPGYVKASGRSDIKFQELISTGPISGVHAYSNMIQRSFFGAGPPKRMLPRRPLGRSHVLACRVTGTMDLPDREEDDADAQDSQEKADAEDTEEEPGTGDVDKVEEKQPSGAFDCIVVADLDAITEQIFYLHRQQIENLDFDNVTFVLNCLDALTGDQSFVALRKRRPKHRVLEYIEERGRKYRNMQLEEAQHAEDDAAKELADAQKSLDARVKQVRDREDLDRRTKEILLATVEEDENRKLDVKKANIENRKKDKIKKSEIAMERSIQNIQSTVKTFAVILPPIPAFILGLFIWFRRIAREQEAISPDRVAGGGRK